MKLAIVGLPNSGKTTLFNALTGQSLEATPYITHKAEPHRAVVKVPDRRLLNLASIFRPRKVTHASIEYIDYLGIMSGESRTNRDIFDLIKDSDAIVHVVRAFSDPLIPHPLESIDPLRDAKIVEFELIFGDLELVDKRLSRIEEARKKGKKPSQEEVNVLHKCREYLEKEMPLRTVEFSEEELKILRPMQFLSDKPEVIVLNIDEAALGTEKNVLMLKEMDKFISEKYDTHKNIKVISLSAKVEMELSRMSEEERNEFLHDLGIDEPASHKLIHSSYELLDLISFFTVGEDEVKAWTIRKGTTAEKAAGRIHSDMERGFIRAEVISYEDFISNSGNTHQIKEKGLMRLEGKSYIVQDGDIITFRFHV